MIGRVIRMTRARDWRGAFHTTFLLLVGFILCMVILLFIGSADGKTIVVDQQGSGDYEFLTPAVENATAGDTIIIEPGTYNEKVVIDKRLDVLGNTTTIPVIAGDGSGTVLSIVSPWVNLSYLHVTDGDIGIGIEANRVRVEQCVCTNTTDGIDLDHAEGVTIQDNDCNRNEIGIHLSYADSNHISNNTCSENEYYGIYLFSSEETTLSRNNCTKNGVGIFLSSSSDNVLEWNDIRENDPDGLRIRESVDVQVSNCTMSGNYENGIFLVTADGITFRDNIINDQENGFLITMDSKDVVLMNNEIHDHSKLGVDASDNDEEVVTAYENWWGHESGPYHPQDNPGGTGDEITDNVRYDPWLNEGERDFFSNLTFDSAQLPATAEPGDFLNIDLTVTNNATNSYVFLLSTAKDPDNLTFIYPSGQEIGPVNQSQETDHTIVILIDEKAPPGMREWEIHITSRDNTRLKKTLKFSINVTQIYDVSVKIVESPSEGNVLPGGVTEYLIEVINSGTGNDTVRIEVPDEIQSVENIPDGWVIEHTGSASFDLEAGKKRTMNFTVDIPMYWEPGTFNITAWFHYHDESRRSTIGIAGEVIVVNRPDLANVTDINATVSPSRDTPGIANIRITLSNEGNVPDTFSYELGSDPSSNRFGHWLTFPDAVSLDPGQAMVIELNVSVPSYEDDPLAFADGLLRDIIVIVYSQGARENGTESLGKSTDSIIIHMDIREFQFAQISSVSPWSMVMLEDEEVEVNITLVNLGNGVEEYSPIRDGQDGTGQHTNWYSFNVSQVSLQPLESIIITMIIRIPEYTPSDIYLLHFHFESTHTFETPEEIVRVEIEETFGAAFIYADNTNSDPGRVVRLDVTVRNTGNRDNDIRMDAVLVPGGWEEPSWVGGGSQMSLPEFTSYDFRLEVSIPDNLPDAVTGLYQFEVTGSFQDGGGSYVPINGSIIVEIFVNPKYSVDVDVLDHQESVEPGKTAHYPITIINNGNINATYQIFFLNPSSGSSAKYWAELSENLTDNIISIPVGESRTFEVLVHVPHFSKENDEARQGSYGLKVRVATIEDLSEVKDVILDLQVRRFESLTITSAMPGREIFKGLYTDKFVTYLVEVQNLGNDFNSINIGVPDSELLGEKMNWDVMFGAMKNRVVSLDPFQRTDVVVTVTVEPETPLGSYTLKIVATSGFDLSVTDSVVLSLNISQGHYGFETNVKPFAHPWVNPADGDVIEYEFQVTNTGSHRDSFMVEVTTPLESEPYRDWIMEFRDRDNDGTQFLYIPEDLASIGTPNLEVGTRVDITLFVIVDPNEDEGDFNQLSIRISSESDPFVEENLSFELTVIRPNIRISSDPFDFYIQPDQDIEVNDDIQVNLRLYNDGGAETGLFHVLFYNGEENSIDEREDNFIGVVTVHNIPARMYQDISFNWLRIKGGNNDIFAYVDKPINYGPRKTHIDNMFSSYGQVWETSEDDNTASLDPLYSDALDLRPDLSIVGVTFGSLEAGKRTRVEVIIVNIGTGPTDDDSGTVHLNIGGTDLKNTDHNSLNPEVIEGLEAGDDMVISFTWIVPETPQNITIVANVDHIDDQDRSNDLYLAFVKTREPRDEGIGTGTILAILILILLIGMTSMLYANRVTEASRNPPRVTEIENDTDSRRELMTSDRFAPNGSWKGDMRDVDESPGEEPMMQDSSVTVVPLGSTEFPVVDRCPGCNAKLRAYNPGLIGCPFCSTTTMVDRDGTFIPMEDDEKGLVEAHSGMLDDVKGERNPDLMSEMINSWMKREINGGMIKENDSRLTSEKNGGMINEIEGGMKREMNGGMIKEIESGLTSEMNGGMIKEIESGLTSEKNGGMIKEIESGMKSEMNGGIIKEIESGMKSEMNGGLMGEIESGLMGEINGEKLYEENQEKMGEMNGGRLDEVNSGMMGEVDSGMFSEKNHGMMNDSVVIIDPKPAIGFEGTIQDQNHRPNGFQSGDETFSRNGNLRDPFVDENTTIEEEVAMSDQNFQNDDETTSELEAIIVPELAQPDQSFESDYDAELRDYPSTTDAPVDLLRQPHWERNELERKYAILSDYEGYYYDPAYEQIVEELEEQIAVMEAYGRRNVMGFPDTSFIYNRKRELKDIISKPKQWRTPEDRRIIRTYPIKIRAFERIVGKSVERLLDELREEEMSAQMREFDESPESFRPKGDLITPTMNEREFAPPSNNGSFKMPETDGVFILDDEFDIDDVEVDSELDEVDSTVEIEILEEWDFDPETDQTEEINEENQEDAIDDERGDEIEEEPDEEFADIGFSEMDSDRTV